MRASHTFVLFALCIGSFAQDRWFSGQVGASHSLYSASLDEAVISGNADLRIGLRFGQDLGVGFRFTIGVFLSEERMEQQLGGTGNIRIHRRGIEVPVLAGFRFGPDERSEWCGSLGPVVLAPQRTWGDQGAGEQDLDVGRRTGLAGRISVRHARGLVGCGWGSVEAFADFPLLQDHEQRSFHYPPANAFELADKAFTFGLLLGIELGPVARSGRP